MRHRGTSSRDPSLRERQSPLIGEWPGQARPCRIAKRKAMRSGLGDQIEEGKRIAERLRGEARGAQQAWALWETLNGGSDFERTRFHDALNYLGLGRQAGFLRGVLVRDALSALFRISDQENNGRLTLCAIARLLHDEDLRKQVACADWLRANGCPDLIVKYEAEAQPRRIAAIQNAVPRKWSDQPPTERALHDLRAKLRDVRDAILAHALDSTSVVQPCVDDVRAFLRISTDLVENAELIFLGSAQATDDHLEVCTKEATTLWRYLEKGPISAHQEDIEKR